ncbi:MAG: hypothetical protein HY046_09580 [Acidobacteria bacterium]|nr:hypothetical protein [Acidobacteriota bacterium]
MNDYVVQSGDTAFATEKWESLRKAYEFLRATYDERGFPKNFGIGHGWVEGGPLLPVKTELYQAGLGIEALRALSNLAQVTGREEMSKALAKDFEKQRALVNESFWIAEKKRFAFALDKNDKKVDEPSVLATVPMWFGLLDEAKADAMITQLADLDHQTDWGMRIISEHSPKFSGGGYHYGSVWPLFTGWAAVGEYRYHRAFAAYENLRSNALLALDGSLGHVTEVLSGDYYQPLSTSSPHQIWSAAMVVSPILRGMFGLSTDAASRTLTFAPHAPAGWTRFTIRNVRAGTAQMDLTYSKDAGAITLEVNCANGAVCPVEFAPSISLSAEVLGAEMNGKPVPFHVAANAEDQHAMVRVDASGKTNTLRIRIRKDFNISYDSSLPPLGSRSEGLRLLSQTWTARRDAVTLELAGAVGAEYKLVVDPGQLASVEGAGPLISETGVQAVRVRFAAGEPSTYMKTRVVFHFSGKPNKKK